MRMLNTLRVLPAVSAALLTAAVAFATGAGAAEVRRSAPFELAQAQFNLPPEAERRRATEREQRRNQRQNDAKRDRFNNQGSARPKPSDERRRRANEARDQRNQGVDRNRPANLRDEVERRRRANEARDQRNQGVDRNRPANLRDEVERRRRAKEARDQRNQGADRNRPANLRDEVERRRRANQDRDERNRELDRRNNPDRDRAGERRRIGGDSDTGRNANWRRELRERRDARNRNRDFARERRERAERRSRRVQDRRLRGEIVRRWDNQILQRRRIRNRDGRYAFARSRRYWVRDRRYRNRYRNGRSVYWMPPAGVAIALGAYVLLSQNATYDDYVDTFTAPPVRRIDRRYSLEEVVADPEVRSAMRSVKLNMITFASGSDEISDDQVEALEELAEAIKAALTRQPDEMILIEGHTDATGSDEANLELSERRAAAVLEVLISEFGIPADNLESVGYGEQYLEIETDGPEERNRRVVIRPVGALLAKGDR